ncbi:Methylamine utilisation protein MauE [Marinactinospora thermotolerans DSM 45154]|uniref:Methylamine utilisation protein MauE n=1 Tax=Marinactinospora thermotolerans DSM 45154 TaxID=1122192 RepID=A0A1T4R4A1_9ACTN|nr:MauE/DoxX family redox-associated membrane protein [Marinactinospora thermotolerans]SKA10892.1 Methylamine utilisation protein MauE [Marinactinospora thermotolerans DSM 45154]
MIDVVREIQLLVLAVMLLLGAAAKFTDRSINGQGPAGLLPVRFHRPVALLHGGTEAALAVGLLVLKGQPGNIVRGATALMFVLAVVTLIQLRKRDPEMGCGCFGGLSSEPVGWRTITRAGLLAVAAVSTVGLPVSGVTALLGSASAHAIVLGAEIVVLGALSPELKEIAFRLTHRTPCELRQVPLRRTMARLRASDLWESNRATITSAEPVDLWRHGCWRFVRFAGRRNGRDVDVVFGVPITGGKSGVRAVIVDAETGTTLVGFGEVAGLSRSDRARGGDGAARAPYEAV